MKSKTLQRRKALMALVAGAMGRHAQANTRPAPLPSSLRAVAAPGRVAQLAAGGPTGLLGVGNGGELWALSLAGGAAQLLGTDLDAATPLATGHGRITARHKSGALWVLEA